MVPGAAPTPPGLGSGGLQLTCLALLGCCTLIALVGCTRLWEGRESGDGARAAAREATAPPLPPAVTLPVPTNTAAPALAAKVNGQPILLSVFEQQLDRFRNDLLAEGIDPATPAGEAALAESRQQVLDGMIDALLVQQAAYDLGIAPSTAETETRVQADIAAAGGSPAFSEWLTATRQTEAVYREAVRLSITLQRVVVAVTGSVPSAGEQVYVRRLELDSVEAAESVLAQFREGANFAQLAQDAASASRRSLAATEPAWAARGMFEIEAESAVFSLVPGEISEPVALGNGRYVLYQVVEHEANRPFSTDVRLALEAQAFRDWLSRRRAEASVERLIGP
jgi:parvulin-like peptidyl-prolyl isomerase